MIHFIFCRGQQNVDERNEKHIRKKKTGERLTKAQVGQEGSVLHLEVWSWRSMESLIYICLIVFHSVYNCCIRSSLWCKYQINLFHYHYLMFSVIFHLISTKGGCKEAVVDPEISQTGGAIPALFNSWSLGPSDIHVP